MSGEGMLDGRVTLSPELTRLLDLGALEIREIVAKSLNTVALEGQQMIRNDITVVSGDLQESITVEEAKASDPIPTAKIYADGTKIKYALIYEFGGKTRNYPAHAPFRRNLAQIQLRARQELSVNLRKHLKGR